MGCGILQFAQCTPRRLIGPRVWTTHPLVRAFVISLVLHVLLFTTLEVGNRFDLWRFSPLAVLANLLKLDLSPSLTAERAASRAITLEQAQRGDRAGDSDSVRRCRSQPGHDGNPGEDQVLLRGQFPGGQPGYESGHGHAGDRRYAGQDSEDDGHGSGADPAAAAAGARGPQQPQDGVSPEVVDPQPVTTTPSPPLPETPPLAQPTPAVAPRRDLDGQGESGGGAGNHRAGPDARRAVAPDSCPSADGGGRAGADANSTRTAPCRGEDETGWRGKTLLDLLVAECAGQSAGELRRQVHRRRPAVLV